MISNMNQYIILTPDDDAATMVAGKIELPTTEIVWEEKDSEAHN